MTDDASAAEEPECQADAVPPHVPIDTVVADWLIHVAGEAQQMADIIDRTEPVRRGR